MAGAVLYHYGLSRLITVSSQYHEYRCLKVPSDIKEYSLDTFLVLFTFQLICLKQSIGVGKGGGEAPQ